MKKTMFITSVIMVVVMAIALTTSSLAWFTAAGSTSVTTNAVTVSAATSSSSGLMLSNDMITFSASAKSPANAAASGLITNVADLKPVVPYGTDVLTALSSNQFTGALITSGATLNSTVWAAGTQYSDHVAGYVYVANAGDADAYLTPTVTFSDVQGATLYVAVLAAGAADEDYTLGGSGSTWEVLRVASSNGTTTVASETTINLAAAAFVNGDAVSTSYDGAAVGPATNNTSTVAVEARAANAAYSHWQKFAILAWYSVDLTNYNAGPTGTSGSFTVTFGRGSAPAVNP